MGDDHVAMGKRILIAVLWALAVWTWVSIARAFLGIPEMGMLAGAITAAFILGRGLFAKDPASLRGRGPISRAHSSGSRSHA